MERTSKSHCRFDSDNNAPDTKKAKLDVNCEGEIKPNVLRKRKVALLVSYCGTGFYGMQKNPDVNTIEEELLSALYKAEAIKEDVKDDLGKHMVATEQTISAANTFLPPAIRIFGWNRVTRGFDCKLNCSARTYEYLLPTYAFAPTFYETRLDYQIKDSTLANVRDILSLYKGTHNYHNYTSGRVATDPSTTRYMINFTASDPFIHHGNQFMCLSVTGQSFMLHQIRKMIGLCIAISKGYCSRNVIEKAWAPAKVDIPRAPGLGLILEMVHYDGYNKRYGNDGLHEPLTWEQQKEEVEKFKREHIWQEIIAKEIQDHPMMHWLATLKCHSYIQDTKQLSPNRDKSSSLENHDNRDEETTKSPCVTETSASSVHNPCSRIKNK